MNTRRLLLILASGAFVASSSNAQDASTPPKAVAAFLKSHCVRCHDAETKSGGLNLTSLPFQLATDEGMAIWVRIHDRVAKGEMPPGKRSKQLAKAHKDGFLAALSKTLTDVHSAHKGALLRRLNRVEYENTLRDLLGIRANLKEMLPEDGKAHGFDNVGEALDISEIHLRQYLKAAQKAIGEAVRKKPQPKKQVEQHSYVGGRRAKDFIGRLWLKRSEGAIVFFSNRYPPCTLETFKAAHDGRYRFRIKGYGYQTDEPISFAIYFGSFGRNPDSRLHGHFSFPPKRATTFTVEAFIRKGETLRITPFGINGGADLRKRGPKQYKGPGLAVQQVEIEGPIISNWPGRGHELLFGKLPVKEIEPANPAIKRRKWYKPKFEIITKNPVPDAEKLLRRFVQLAFRRPVTDIQVQPYLNLVKTRLAEGDNFEQALQTGYMAVLCSPGFLYLRENGGKLDDFSLANRLSYFLWSSMPDAELMKLAEGKRLSDPKVLRAQTERMLNDAKAKRFTKNFVGQWLDLRNIDFTVPDRQLYPEFDAMLEEASIRETEGFFDEILKNNLSLVNFLDSDWTILNERLAKHYGVAGVKGTEFRKVKLDPDIPRGGVLTQASILRVSANGTTTSPVVRGAWVLDRIFGTPPSPPPPGIPGVEPDIRGATTLRELLRKHRNLQSCAVCHHEIDPPGFALENFDVIGGWRDHYRSKGKDFPFPKVRKFYERRLNYRIGPKVDASGETAGGRKFNGIREFKEILLDNKTQFARNLVEKVSTYATGRPMGFSDRPLIDEIVRRVEANDYGFRELIHEIVQSPIFQQK